VSSKPPGVVAHEGTWARHERVATDATDATAEANAERGGGAPAWTLRGEGASATGGTNEAVAESAVTTGSRFVAVMVVGGTCVSSLAHLFDARFEFLTWRGEEIRRHKANEASPSKRTRLVVTSRI
jgi:hypothetical protein